MRGKATGPGSWLAAAATAARLSTVPAAGAHGFSSRSGSRRDSHGKAPLGFRRSRLSRDLGVPGN